VTQDSIVSQLIADPANDKYSLVGKTSMFKMIPGFTAPGTVLSSFKYTFNVLRNLSLISCFLLVDYYFIDDDERYRFAQNKHDYLIEQLFFTPNVLIENLNRNVRLSIDQPCKLLVWVAQMQFN